MIYVLLLFVFLFAVLEGLWLLVHIRTLEQSVESTLAAALGQIVALERDRDQMRQEIVALRGPRDFKPEDLIGTTSKTFRTPQTFMINIP